MEIKKGNFEFSYSFTFGSASSIISNIAASLYSFQASAFLAIFSASALALASIENASASPCKILASAVAAMRQFFKFDS